VPDGFRILTIYEEVDCRARRSRHGKARLHRPILVIERCLMKTNVRATGLTSGREDEFVLVRG
jgi:hypothetical protein